MPRVQLALNVSNLEEAINFYSKLLDADPAKVRQGYANFAISNPSLKLVLVENPTKAGGSLDHLGIEVETSEQVAAAGERLAAQGLATTAEDHVACCYALQDKVWVRGPDGEPWEIYTVLASSDEPPGQAVSPALVSCCSCCSGPTSGAGD